MNATVIRLFLTADICSSPAFSSLHRISIAKSGFDRLFSPIVRDCISLSVSFTQFSRILSSVIVFDGLHIYNNTFFFSYLSLEGENSSVLITNCAFFNITGSNSVITASYFRQSADFAISFCSFYICRITGQQNTCCIDLVGCYCFIDHVCCSKCDSFDQSFASIVNKASFNTYLNESTIAFCGPNNNKLLSVVFLVGDIRTLNISSSVLRYDSSTAFFSNKCSEYTSIKFIQFCSNSVLVEFSAYAILFITSVSDLIFTNSSNVNGTSYLILASSSGGNISNIFDINNINCENKFVPRFEGVTFSFVHYYTDRENISTDRVNITDVEMIGAEGIPEWGRKQRLLCTAVSAPIATAVASVTPFNNVRSAVFVTIGVVVCAGLTVIAWLSVVRIRYKRKISELTKTIDLDDALASIQ